MTINARTDPDTGLRLYSWAGKDDYISVTSVRKLLGMPHPLHNWVLTQVVDRAVDELETLEAMLTRDPTSSREKLVEANRIKETKSWLRSAATEKRDKAADRGIGVHEAIALGLSPDDPSLTPDVVPYMWQWVYAKRELGITVHYSERQIWSLKGYAGTIDLLVTIAALANRKFLLDTKTSAGVYIDHAVQLVAYAASDWIGENDIVDQVATDMLHTVDGMGVLHLGPDKWELVEIEPSAKLFAAFDGSLIYARFMLEHHEAIDSLIRQTITAKPKEVGVTP